ncbi:hypothetical protein H9P43_003694 [Blastocladiella emersonii ATCC 22665]|nr:hypothetical protein H9P43_003694 [Blastocladiella emersonii ATCC 22665]
MPFLQSIRPETRGKRLRFIHAGAPLPPTPTLRSISRQLLVTRAPVQPNAVCVGADADAELPRPDWTGASLSTLIAHVSISDPVPGGPSGGSGYATFEGDAENAPGDPAAAPAIPRGFDTMIGAAFTADDVVAFRREFHAARGTSDADADTQLRLEDAWVAGEQSAEDHHQLELTENTMFRDLLAGAAVGYFLGLIALFFFRIPGVANQRQAIGVGCGLVLNLSMGFFWWLNA